MGDKSNQEENLDGALVSQGWGYQETPTYGVGRVSLLWPMFGEYMLSAAIFTRLSSKIENVNNPAFPTQFRIEHNAYVASAILFSVLSVEARINELFIYAVNKNYDSFKEGGYSLEPAVIDNIGWFWSKVEKEESFLYKYELALHLAKGNDVVRTFRSNNKFEKMRYLNGLRNGLVHYKPDWSDTQAKIMERAQSEGKGSIPSWNYLLTLEKIKPNPFALNQTVYFPDQILSHSCAAWSVKTAIAFIEWFYFNMGLSSHLSDYGNQLDTE